MATKALVTGANGFIGSHLVEYLQDRGDHPYAMVRETSNLDNLAGAEVEFRYASLDDIDSLSEAMQGVDVVYHVAGITAAFNSEVLDRVNSQGTANVLEAARRAKNGPRRVLYVSSLEAAGQSHHDCARAEHHRPEPFTRYGTSKFGGEQAAWTAAQHADIEVVIVRPPLVYGPRDLDVLQMLQSAKWGIVATPLGRNGWISAIHCHDLVRGIVLVGERGRKLPAGGDGRHVLEGGGAANDQPVDESSHPAGEGIYFLDDGGRHTIAHFGQQAAAALGKKALTIPTPKAVIWMSAVAAETAGRFTGRAPALNRDKVTASFATGWWCDATRARAELGYQVEMPLDVGLHQWVGWLRENKLL
jgi:nucleoside-diphosphate-sugar epimerase